jgi:very-short-patch-repair endonuclease/predicted transcriptional regulator of viral defense system
MPPEIDKTRSIDQERRSRDVDLAIVAIAERQHGVIDHPQLLRLGLDDDAIQWRIKRGHLHPIHRGVYAVGHRCLGREGRYLAAALFAGEGAVLSHCAAADLWELRASKEPTIDVTVPCDRRGDAIVQIHRDALDGIETITRHGIRVTKPLRTLLDLAAVINDQTEIERAIRQAVYRRLTTTTLLAEAVHDRPGQRGTKRLRYALINVGEAPGLTRSQLEERFVRLLRKHKLPMPELNIRLGDIEVDCLWRDQRLIVELDGRDAHDSTPAFESDRARDSALTAALWRVVRVTSRRIRRDGDRLAAELRALLA